MLRWYPKITDEHTTINKARQLPSTLIITLDRREIYTHDKSEVYTKEQGWIPLIIYLHVCHKRINIKRCFPCHSSSRYTSIVVEYQHDLDTLLELPLLWKGYWYDLQDQ